MKHKNRMLMIMNMVTIAMALLLTGCASPATVNGMRPQSLAPQNKQPYSVSVQATGGEKTNPLWTSEISSESFAQAVREGIVESGLFRSVVTNGNGDYLLEVSLIKVNKPLAGFDMTVNLTANWKLTHIATRKIVYQDDISKSYTATVGDAFAGIKRLRLAEEGAARENITEGLNRISRLNLQGNE